MGHSFVITSNSNGVAPSPGLQARDLTRLALDAPAHVALIGNRLYRRLAAGSHSKFNHLLHAERTRTSVRLNVPKRAAALRF